MNWRLHVTTLYQDTLKTDIIEFETRDKAEMAKYRFKELSTDIVAYQVIPLY